MCILVNVLALPPVIPVRDTGIQFLLYDRPVCSFAIKFSGSQCLGTGMTSFGFLYGYARNLV